MKRKAKYKIGDWVKYSGNRLRILKIVYVVTEKWTEITYRGRQYWKQGGDWISSCDADAPRGGVHEMEIEGLSTAPK